MLPIPIGVGKQICDRYGYDQVVIIARRVGEGDEERGEHVTTYGVDSTHCGVAARIGDYVKYEIMKWERGSETRHETGEKK